MADLKLLSNQERLKSTPACFITTVAENTFLNVLHYFTSTYFTGSDLTGNNC